MVSFSECKEAFDRIIGVNGTLPQSLVTVNGKIIEDIKLQSEDGTLLEEYYKWQFIYALLDSRLYSKDYIGTEIRFPKGSKTSAPLRLDGAGLVPGILDSSLPGDSRYFYMDDLIRTIFSNNQWQ